MQNFKAVANAMEKLAQKKDTKDTREIAQTVSDTVSPD
jgi:hypothetical protein